MTTLLSFDTDAGGAARLRGWRLTGLAALFVCLMAAGLLAFYGAGEAGLRSVIRNTARTSFVLFVAGFVGPALAVLRPARATRWLAENQSHLFAAFAASHLFHAAAIFTLARQTRGASLEGRSTHEIAAGGVIYLFIAASAAAAFPPAARWLASHRAARAVRAFGLYAVWLTFMDSYGGRAAAPSLLYLPFALVLLAALALSLRDALSRRPRPKKVSGAPTTPATRRPPQLSS